MTAMTEPLNVQPIYTIIAFVVVSLRLAGLRAFRALIRPLQCSFLNRAMHSLRRVQTIRSSIFLLPGQNSRSIFFVIAALASIDNIATLVGRLAIRFTHSLVIRLLPLFASQNGFRAVRQIPLMHISITSLAVFEWHHEV